MGGVLIYKNSSTEGPGLLAEVLDRHGIPYAVAERARGQPLDPRGFDAVVLLGGPQSANDRDAATRQLLGAVRRVVRTGTPFLGICLGGQLLARALGAEVTRAPAPEYGASTVHLTQAARRDGVFRELPERLPVFQWHGETFGVPRGRVLLACHDVMERATPLPTTPRDARARRRAPALKVSGARRLARVDRQQNQAFRAGSAWGLQFHNETTPEMVERWARLGTRELRRAGVEPQRMVSAYGLQARAIGRAGERMTGGFLREADLL